MGSDEEAALLKAIALVFNGVKQVTCTRHLRENTGRKLDSLLGSRQPVRRAVYDGLFGDSGIVKACSMTRLPAFGRAHLRQHHQHFSSTLKTAYCTMCVTMSVLAGLDGLTTIAKVLNHVLKTETVHTVAATAAPRAHTETARSRLCTIRRGR